MADCFEILVNGVPRSYRDVAAIAIAGGQALKARDLGSEVIVVNQSTREWSVIKDVFSPPVWNPPAQVPTARAE